MNDWYISLSHINRKIDVYVIINIDTNVKYTAYAIQDVCEMRDLHNFELFDHNQLEQCI